MRTHPAPFPEYLLPHLIEALSPGLPGERLLDPFAGEGQGLAAIAHALGMVPVGVDIEPWPNRHQCVIVGDSLTLSTLIDGRVRRLVTSPTYGNGVNDDFRSSKSDTSRRYTYGHALRAAYGDDYEMAEHNTGRHGHRRGAKSMLEFFRLTAAALDEWPKVLEVGGLAVVNTKDTVNTKGETVVPLTEWFEGAMRRRGFVKIAHRPVPAQGLRDGANAGVRNPWEHVVTYKLSKAVSQ